MISWLRSGLSRPVVLRAVRVAAFVGSLLVLLNHGPAIIAEGISPGRGLQILLTYLIPFGVSAYSAVEATR